MQDIIVIIASLIIGGVLTNMYNDSNSTPDTSIKTVTLQCEVKR